MELSQNFRANFSVKCDLNLNQISAPNIDHVED